MVRKIGNNAKNVINGTTGADQLFGLGGNDKLVGKGGNDLLNGGKGNDLLDGGTGNDKLIGGLGHDKLLGGRGADNLNGGAGDDILAPGDDLNADVINGGAGTDTVDYSSNTGQVQAYLAVNSGAFGAAGDNYISVENVIGTAFDDFLQNAGGGTAFGGGGNDMLYGGGIKDSTGDGGTVRGDAGFDTLDMTYGNTHAWVQNGQGLDTINGFDEGFDKFFFKSSDFGLGNSFDAAEITNDNNHAATGANAQFIYDGDSFDLWFDANGTGAGGQTLIAHFTNAVINGANLGVNDFDFIV